MRISKFEDEAEDWNDESEEAGEDEEELSF